MGRRGRRDIRLVGPGGSRPDVPAEESTGFSELLSRMRFREECYAPRKGGESTAGDAGLPRFTGAELVALLRTLPPVDKEFLTTLEELATALPRIQ